MSPRYCLNSVVDDTSTTLLIVFQYKIRFPFDTSPLPRNQEIFNLSSALMYNQIESYVCNKTLTLPCFKNNKSQDKESDYSNTENENNILKRTRTSPSSSPNDNRTRKQ